MIAARDEAVRQLAAFVAKEAALRLGRARDMLAEDGAQ